MKIEIDLVENTASKKVVCLMRGCHFIDKCNNHYSASSEESRHGFCPNLSIVDGGCHCQTYDVEETKVDGMSWPKDAILSDQKAEV